MTDVKAFLAAKVGREKLTEETGHEFTVRAANSRRSAVFDLYNRRVKIYGLVPADLEAPEVATLVGGLGEAPELYTKLTVYALPGDDEAWIKRMFLREGVILGYFPNHLHADLWASYADDARMEAPRDAEHDRIVALAAQKETKAPFLAEGYTSRVAVEADAFVLAELLRNTFEDYPAPLDAATLREAIANRRNHFRCVFDRHGEMVAAASAELDHGRSVAEMTDCATDPEHRGKGLMAYILWCLEKDIAERFDITDVYTLARADEPGMNCVFSKLGYHYTGRLVNNCRMPNGWESMNVWCRVHEPGADAPPTLL
jgi:putative beta-lysine N-acetyltransferase